MFIGAFQSLLAQVDEYSDVVELKDGNKVVGKIIENKPGEYVIIQSRSGSSFTFKPEEVKNIIQKGKSIKKSVNLPETQIKTDSMTHATPKDSSLLKNVQKNEGTTVRQQKSEPPVSRQYETIYMSPDTLNLRVDIQGGYSYRMAKVSENISSEFKDYINKLKSGYNISGNVSYFFTDEYGICLDYSRFMTSNSMNGVYLYDPYDPSVPTQGPGKMEDNISISFIGIGLAGRKIFNDGNILLVGNFALGSASYHNDAKLIDSSYTIEGSTFGYYGMLNLDFMISSHWALGFGISYLGGTLKNATVNGVSADLGEENLFRFDFNAGIRFYY
jgi:hypothetical protein